MTIEAISRILENHSVPYFVSGSHIYADRMEAFAPPFAEVDDLTGISLPSLREWLGY